MVFFVFLCFRVFVIKDLIFSGFNNQFSMSLFPLGFIYCGRCVVVDIRTHLAIDQALCGKPQLIEDGESRVAFTALPEMAADKSGLVHGGFVFGLGDYAAMLAVNHPNVVLGSADVKFLSPVQVGDTLEARHRFRKWMGKNRWWMLSSSKSDKTVFTGRFTCFVLDTHILD